MYSCAAAPYAIDTRARQRQITNSPPPSHVSNGITCTIEQFDERKPYAADQAQPIELVPQTDLHVAEALGDGSFRYLGKLEGANSGALDGVPTMDRAGNFYFVSPRSFEDTKATIHTGRYASGRLAGVRLVPGSLSRDTTFWFNMDVEVSADGNRLYATDNIQRYLLGGGIAQSNFFVAERRDGGFYRSEHSEEIFEAINTVKLEYAAAISEDELTIFFNRTDIDALRREDMRGIGIFMAMRPTPDAAFESPKRIEAITGFVEGPTVSADDCILYYHRKNGEMFSLYRVTREDCVRR